MITKYSDAVVNLVEFAGKHTFILIPLTIFW